MLVEITADSLKLNTLASIVGVEANEDGNRLSELGFYPGKRLVLLNAAPFGGPLAFELGNTVVALRRDEARLIRVSPFPELVNG